MYEDFFKFSEKPFDITPNSRFLFLSMTHKEVLAHLLYGIRSHCGFVEIIGEVGTGKTTILRTLFSELDNKDYHFGYIFNPRLSPLELLRSINKEYRLPFDSSDSTDLLGSLNDFLLKENAAGRTVVLVIDEAQGLPVETLEQLRLISNLETETFKLIQIILVGQPELEKKLGLPELRQLNQRITVRYRLQPLNFHYTKAYINHRLNKAGSKGRVIFSPWAVKKVYRYSKGIPRSINILCDRALLIGFSEDSCKISGSIVGRAFRELNLHRGLGLSFKVAGISIFCALALLGGWKFQERQPAGVEIQMPAKKSIVRAPISIPPAIASRLKGKSTADINHVRRELADMDEVENLATAFNTLAESWQIEPLTEDEKFKLPDGLEDIVRDRRLEITPFTENVESILTVDAPTILTLFLPGAKGKRYLFLSGVSDDKVFISPSVQGKDFLFINELKKIWFGKGYLVWKNYRQIPFLSTIGERGKGVFRLQELLQKAGFYSGETTGVFDKPTIAAVMAFQADIGIPMDGRVGPQTLLLLYRATGYFNPREVSLIADKGEA